MTLLVNFESNYRYEELWLSDLKSYLRTVRISVLGVPEREFKGVSVMFLAAVNYCEEPQSWASLQLKRIH